MNRDDIRMDRDRVIQAHDATAAELRKTRADLERLGDEVRELRGCPWRVGDDATPTAEAWAEYGLPGKRRPCPVEAVQADVAQVLLDVGEGRRWVFRFGELEPKPPEAVNPGDGWGEVETFGPTRVRFRAEPRGVVQTPSGLGFAFRLTVQRWDGEGWTGVEVRNAPEKPSIIAPSALIVPRIIGKA